MVLAIHKHFMYNLNLLKATVTVQVQVTNKFLSAHLSEIDNQQKSQANFADI